jgi:hypothetical protein
LSAIGHQGVFRLSGWSRQIRTRFLGPRTTWDPTREPTKFQLQGYHLLCRPFPRPSPITLVSYSLIDCQIDLNGPTTPQLQRLTAITQLRFSLFRFRSPLLAESLLFSLPVGTEMFHFPTCPPPVLCVQTGVPEHYLRWVSPFGNPRFIAWLAAPRGLSQPPTSFIGSWCQGIHRAPLLTCYTNLKMLASTVQFSSNGRKSLVIRGLPANRRFLTARGPY